MKIVNTLIASILILAISLTAYADMDQQTQSIDKAGSTMTTSMPMMGNQQGGMPMMGNQQDGMPMMGNQQGGMPMMGNQQRRMQMMANRQGMMYSMMAQKQQHMYQMEKHLANIEALLKEILIIQKANQSIQVK